MCAKIMVLAIKILLITFMSCIHTNARLQLIQPSNKTNVNLIYVMYTYKRMLSQLIQP
jgi:hypothetical protein